VTAAEAREKEAIVSGPEKKVLDLRPIFGLQATITTPAAATDGAYFEIDDVLEPGGHATDHYHPAQEETFQVLDGTLEVFRDGGWHKVPAGESSTVPRGATHAFRNASQTPVRFLNSHRPALTFQEFLETVDGLIRAGKIKGPRDLRSGIYLSMAAVERGTAVQVKPPQMLLRGLAFIGRRLGYRLE
jgi:quercetin dioxygenase-like cupin family protein